MIHPPARVVGKCFSGKHLKSDRQKVPGAIPTALSLDHVLDRRVDPDQPNPPMSGRLIGLSCARWPVALAAAMVSCPHSAFANALSALRWGMASGSRTIPQFDERMVGTNSVLLRCCMIDISAAPTSRGILPT